MKKNKTDNRIKRIVAGGCALILMCVIFFFSSQPGEASDETSIGLLAMLFGQGLDFGLLWNALARKVAHVLEYGALTVPVYFFFGTFRWSRAGQNLVTALCCVLYAVSDEIHQLFVEARSCEAFDVLVDALGVLAAVVGLHLLTTVLGGRRQKKTAVPVAPEADDLVLSAFSAFVTGRQMKERLPDAQFGAFVETSRAHKILPMTADALSASGETLLPEHRAALKREAALQTVMQIRRTEVFLRAYRAMRAAGAAPLCVKGAVCRSLYPNPDLRASADEDLLVREADLACCIDTLRGLGFTASGPASGYEITFRENASGCVIELHRSLFPEDGGVYSRFNELLGDLFRDSETVTVDGTELLCAAPTSHMFYMVLHAFKHFLVAGVGIRQLADIAVFAQHNDIDWQGLFEKCAVVRLTGFLSAVLRIGADRFGLDVSGVSSPLFDAGVDAAALLRDVMKGGVYGARNADSRRSGNLTFKAYAAVLLQKKTSIFAAIFPPKDSIRRKYAYADRHGWLLPVAYISRILNYFFRRHDTAATFSTAEKRSELMRRYGIS